MSGEFKNRWTDGVTDYLGNELLGKQENSMWQITCKDNIDDSHVGCAGIEPFVTNHITGNRF